jgi:predicted RNase H-like nuclease
MDEHQKKMKEAFEDGRKACRDGFDNLAVFCGYIGVYRQQWHAGWNFQNVENNNAGV